VRQRHTYTVTSNQSINNNFYSVSHRTCTKQYEIWQ